METATDWKRVYTLYKEARVLFSADEQSSAYAGFLGALNACFQSDKSFIVKNIGNDEALIASESSQSQGVASDFIESLPLLFPENSCTTIEQDHLAGLQQGLGLKNEEFTSAVCIALEVDSEAAFCIVMFRKGEGSAFTQDEVERIGNMVVFLGDVVGNAKLVADNAGIASELRVLRKRQSVWLETLAWLNELGKSHFDSESLKIAVFKLQTLVVADSAVAFGFPKKSKQLTCLIKKEGEGLSDCIQAVIDKHLKLEEIEPSVGKIMVKQSEFPDLGEFGFVECLCFPLFVKKKFHMLICLARKQQKFDVNEVMVATLFAEGIEHIIERMFLMRSIRRQNLILQKEKEEQQKLIEQLNEAQMQLAQQEKMASIGQLAAGVAHEINNPVGFVNSNINSMENYMSDLFSLVQAYEAMESQLPEDDPKRSEIKAIKDDIDYEFIRDDVKDLIVESKDGVERVRQIVKDLKDFSHVDQADWQEADLINGIDSTLNIVHNDLKYKAEIVKEYQDIPKVECVQSQINQIVMNMLVNAGHAIETQGTITIRAFRVGEEMVAIEVEDTGKGIPEENLSKIFDPFFTTKPVGSGTGLGLSVSYSIAEQHGGELSVRSEVGKGTCFTLTLPIKHVDVPDEDAEES